jgi:ketosteroid isomerase-like protein
MRFLSKAVIIALAVGSVAIAQSVEQQVTKLENDWVKAMIAKDYAVLDRALADDYTDSGDPDGSVHTKSDMVSALKSGQIAISSYKYADLKVRVYGNAAIVTGLQTFVSTFKGKDDSGTFRFTDTWIKKGDSWQCVVEHSSRVEKPKS